MGENKIQIIIEALNRTDAAFNDLKRHLTDSHDATDKLNTKSQNLTGSIIRLAASVVSLGTALQVIKSGITYLSQIETATLGIASAFITGGKYIDSTSGKALAAQDALSAAQGDSKKIIEELQFANLQTIATLDELIAAYQVTLPVALARGFDRQQVKDFTVAMVQAAGAIGLQMNQLGEETRSLLTASIDPRNSRIATVLGLRNEDINQYKGNAKGLFDFLMEKLAAYRVAGVESQNTWNGLWSNAKDIVSQALGKKLEPLFEALKYELKSVADSIVTIDDKAKKITWNPEFLSGVNATREGIVSIIAEVYRLGMLLDKIGATYARLMHRVQYGVTASSSTYAAEAGIYEPAPTDKDTKYSKMEDDYRQRYMQSDKALQDLAMRAEGWMPVTADIDKKMREASAAGKKLYQQMQVTIGSESDSTNQLLRYYKKIGEPESKWNPNPQKTDEDKKLKKLREEWTKSLRDMKSDETSALSSYGSKELDEYGKKIEDIQNKAEELIDKFRAIPGAAGEIKKWMSTMIDRESLETQKKEYGKLYETQLKGHNSLAALDRELTETTSTEQQKRMNAVKINARKQEELADEAYASGVINAEQLSEKYIQIKNAENEQKKKLTDEYNRTVREAAISSQLAELDVAEAAGTYHRDTLSERIRLTTELIGVQEEALKSIDRLKDPTGWYTQKKAIEETKKALLGLKEESSPVTAALNKYADAATDTWKNIGDALSRNMKNMEDTLVEFVTTGKASFSDLVNSILKDLARIAIQKTITGPLSSGLGSIIGSVFGMFSSSGEMNTGEPIHVGEGGTTAFGMHRGGMGYEAPTFYRIVPSRVFDDASRYHTGIGPRERAAVILENEGVFTQGQMKSMAPVSALIEAVKAAIGGRSGNTLTVSVPVNVEGGNNKLAAALQSGIEDTVVKILRKHS